MIAAYLVAFILFTVLFFAFFHYSPKNRKGVAAFNIGIFVLTGSLCAWYVCKLHGEMAGTLDSEWFIYIAPLATLGIAIVVLAVSSLLRNYVVFRR